MSSMRSGLASRMSALKSRAPIVPRAPMAEELAEVPPAPRVASPVREKPVLRAVSPPREVPALPPRQPVRRVSPVAEVPRAVSPTREVPVLPPRPVVRRTSPAAEVPRAVSPPRAALPPRQPVRRVSPVAEVPQVVSPPRAALPPRQPARRVSPAVGAAVPALPPRQPVRRVSPPAEVPRAVSPPRVVEQVASPPRKIPEKKVVNVVPGVRIPSRRSEEKIRTPSPLPQQLPLALIRDLTTIHPDLALQEGELYAVGVKPVGLPVASTAVRKSTPLTVPASVSAQGSVRASPTRSDIIASVGLDIDTLNESESAGRGKGYTVEQLKVFIDEINALKAEDQHGKMIVIKKAGRKAELVANIKQGLGIM